VYTKQQKEGERETRAVNRMQYFTYRLVLFTASLLILGGNAEGGGQEEKQCSIYLAKSSLKGHTGFGVYTTRDIAQGKAILSGPPGTPDGPTIAVVDSMRNTPFDLLPAQHQFHNTFGHYWWGRGVPDHVGFESDEGDVIDYQITFGALPNHQCILSGIDYVLPESPYEDSLVSRYEDPGAGSFTYHRGRIFQATRDLTAGSELFLSYGYCESIPKGAEGTDEGLHYPTWARDLPMRGDYREARRTLTNFWTALVQEFGSQDGIPADLEFDPAPDMSPQVSQLMPKNFAQLKRIIESSVGDMMGDVFDRAIAQELLTESRTVDWIRENGMCVENLIPGKSTIKQAGQGGFAQHRIRKGELVVPAPALQVADRRALMIFDENGKAIGEQLLLNYCFGHKDTSLLICPDTNAILVNHCSDRTKKCGPKGPNAKFQWASGWDPDTPTWLTMSVDDIAKEEGRGLSLEIVALRDIEPGEEVFMDYGEEWEEAWAAHVASWSPPEDGREYKSVKDLNNDPHGLDMFVSHDLRTEIEHPYLFTGCFYYPTEMDNDENWIPDESINLDELSDEEMLERYGDDGSEYVQDYSSHGDGAHWPCALLYEEIDENKAGETTDASVKSPPSTYTVRIIERDYHEYGEMPWTANDLPRFLFNFPRESIHIFAKPHQSDQQMSGTFRHHIPLRDDMVPAVWKNLGEGVQKSQKRIIPRVPLSPIEAMRLMKEQEEEEEDESEEEE